MIHFRPSGVGGSWNFYLRWFRDLNRVAEITEITESLRPVWFSGRVTCRYPGLRATAWTLSFESQRQMSDRAGVLLAACSIGLFVTELAPN